MWKCKFGEALWWRKALQRGTERPGWEPERFGFEYSTKHRKSFHYFNYDVLIYKMPFTSQGIYEDVMGKYLEGFHSCYMF